MMDSFIMRAILIVIRTPLATPYLQILTLFLDYQRKSGETLAED